MLALISLAMMSGALIPHASAADTVVYPGGDAAAAIRRVTVQMDVPPDSLHAVSVAELMANKAPTMVAGGYLSLCAGVPSSGDAVKQSLTLAEGAVKYMEYGSARAALDAAIKDLGCLQSPVDTAQAARAFYLRGIVNAASGDQAASRNDFRRARLFAPTMIWDENFAPAARGTFDAIAKEVESASLVSLTILPSPSDGTVRLDGRPLQLRDGHAAIAVGDHYVQIGDSPAVTFTLSVDNSAPPTLVLPSAVGPEVLDWASDGEKRKALSAVLVSALGSDGTVYVVNPKAVWREKLGSAAWDLLDQISGPAVAATTPREATSTKITEKTPDNKVVPTATLPVAPVAPTDAKKKKSLLGPILMGVGGAVGVGGAISGVIGYEKAISAYRMYVGQGNSGEPGDPSDKNEEDYIAGGEQEILGLIVAGVGGAVLTTGLVVTVAF